MKIMHEVRSIVAQENAQQVKEFSPKLIKNNWKKNFEINLDHAFDDLSSDCSQCMFERNGLFDCASCENEMT